MLCPNPASRDAELDHGAFSGKKVGFREPRRVSAQLERGADGFSVISLAAEWDGDRCGHSRSIAEGIDVVRMNIDREAHFIHAVRALVYVRIQVSGANRFGEVVISVKRDRTTAYGSSHFFEHFR